MNNLYPQPDEDAAAPDMAGDDETKGKGEGMDESEGALIPKSLLAGKEFKPGDEVVLKIVRDYGDQVEVQYAKEKGGEDDADPDDAQPTGSEMDQAQAKLGAMGGMGMGEGS